MASLQIACSFRHRQKASLGFLLAAALTGSSAFGAPEPSAEFKKQIVPLLEDYCYDCHGEGTKKGDFSLDNYQSLDSHLNNIELWFSVWKNVQAQLMPPAD